MDRKAGLIAETLAIVMILGAASAQDQALQLRNLDANLNSQLRITSPPTAVKSLQPKHLTVELWIRPLGPGYGHTTDDDYGADIAYRGDDITPQGLTVASWVLRWSPPSLQPHALHLNYQLNLSQTQGAIWFSNATVPIGTAAHIAMTYDEKVVKFYVNGELDSEHPWTSPIDYDDEDSVWVGTGQGTQTNGDLYIRRFDGEVDSLRIWDHARTQAEIKTSMHCGNLDATADLRGSWSFDDGTAHDSSIYANDGVVEGTGDSFIAGFADQQDCSTAWTDLFHAKAGAGGLPHLQGAGTLGSGATNALHLAGAAPAAPVTLVVGLTAINAPFKGGTLVPSVQALVALSTNGLGSMDLPFVLPPGLPSGFSLFFQTWIVDPTVSHGLASSNGLQGVTP